MTKRLLLYMALLLMPFGTAWSADDMTSYLPANWGGWVNLSASVNDLTYYDSNQLPMQAAVSGETLHVFWTDWKPNAKGEYCVYYRRSADAGKTWEDARVIVASKNLRMVDVNYVGGSFGTNAKWFNVEGQNVQVVTIQESDDNKYSELLYTYSADGGKTFETRQLTKGGENYHFGRPHVVSDGQTVVVAFQQGKYAGTPYHTRVLTSFDGGKTFSDKEIDLSQELGDVQVSGRRWAVLGEVDDWNNGMLRGNVYVSTSADGGQTVSTQNVAPIVVDKERDWTDRSWGSLEFMKGHNGDAYNYHPQMTLEGDAINVVFRGCAKEVEGKRPTNDRNHTIFRRSTDGGKTWSEAIYLPRSNGSDCAIAAKGDHIYVLQAVNGPLMTYSHDGGKTWDVQTRCFWEGNSNGYGNFYDLYLAPDDTSGQHVYMTGVRGLLVESKDGFRTVHRNFSIGTESWYGGRSNNHSLTVLLDSKGTEHWVMNYTGPYPSNKDYFWNIVYRRNDPAPATGSKNMALDISEIANAVDRPLTNVTIPMTPSLMATAEATTVECWVRVDQDTRFQIASLTNDAADHKGSTYHGGWGIEVSSDANDWFTFWAYLGTDRSVDAVGKSIWDRWRYQVKEWGKWHHVALTYDSRVEKDNIRLYADGLLLGTATESGKIKMGSNPIVIGRAGTYYDPKGLVDNFAIYSRALSQEEIQQHLYNMPDANDKDCRLLLTFDGSLQDKSQYKNDPAPLMDAILVEHDGIRAPHPQFTMTKDSKGQKVYVNDMTQDGEACWWVLPYPGRTNDYKTSDKRHVEQDFSRDPGTYSYTLVAKGTGSCNAYASTVQTLVVGGLTRVFPDAAGQSDDVELRIQGGYTLTSNRQPRVLLKQGATEIEGKWRLKSGYDASKITSIDDLAPALFDLSSAPTGQYDVIVDNDTLHQAFTVEKSEGPDVWMQVNGFDRMLWNKYQLLTIDYGNRSNTPAYNVPFLLFIPDKGGNIDVSFDFETDVDYPYYDDVVKKIYGKLNDYMMGYDEQTGDSIRCYMFLIPYIGANSTKQKTFRICYHYPGDEQILSLKEEVSIYYQIEEPWGWIPSDSEAARRKELWTSEQWECMLRLLGENTLWDAVIGQVPEWGCYSSGAKTYIDFTRDIYNRDGSDFFGNLWKNGVSMAITCLPDVLAIAFPEVVIPIKLASIGVGFAWSLINTQLSRDGCLEAQRYKKNIFGVRSYDPNEMIGPWGPDDQRHYIQPIHNMNYTITFENKSSATAPAHEVFVTDTLDATKYDLSTFGFSGFGWAENSYTVGGSKTKEFTRDMIYKVKGQDILVRVSGQFDEQTGIASWAFVSLDKNGNEIYDPDLGFLVPNNDNRDGEGFVSFNIEHKPNPANGSTVSNKATIIFDANDPIVTNTYVNTFDTDYPTSKIVKVEERNGQLEVTVQGSDGTSGIGSYTIFAFKNGGNAEKVAEITGDQAIFACDPGTRYGLCVIATDRVGWQEPKDIKPETEFYTSGQSQQQTTIDVTVAEAGYATFYDSQANYTLPAGLKASVVSSISGSSLNYQSISGNIVPKKTAVLIEANQKKASTYTLTSTTDAASYTGKNLLHGSDVTTTVSSDSQSSDYYFYKLAYGPSGTSQAKSFGWYWGAQNGAAFRIEGHRAWLAVPKSSGARAYLIDGSTTGIEDIEAPSSAPAFTDLQGRHINKPTQPGIYLQNGRKIVVK